MANSPSDTAFFGHPRGLATLFFTEYWERFSYYGMRALLILFMTAPLASGGLGFATPKAAAIYAAYVGAVYLMALPGGWMADHFFGQRRAVLYGGIVIMCGHISLAIPTLTGFYAGLLMVIVGTGLLKPNVSAMVGQLYTPEDHRRDAGFSLYYMGINLGAFVAPFLTGWLAQSALAQGLLARIGVAPESSWHWGFAVAAVGMFCGLIQYTKGWKHLGEAGLEVPEAHSPEARASRNLKFGAGVLGVAGAATIIAVLASTGRIVITPELVSRWFGILLLAIVISVFALLLLSKGWTPRERKQVIVILVLFVSSAIFWALYEQAGSTLNLFAQRNTDSSILGHPFPPSWFQSVPALFVITLAPVFAWLWVRLGDREPGSTAKFTIGLVLVSLGFAVLIIPASRSGLASPLWLVLTYLLHVMGELCLSPVGLSAMTRLAPPRVAGMMMGVWFLATSVGSFLAGRVAGLYEAFSLPTLFGVVAAVAMVAAVIMALLIRPIRRMLASG